MFTRSNESYLVDENIVTSILGDVSSPIQVIASNIRDNSSVLDIGAGSAVLPRVLQAMAKKVDIDGIEPNKFAADLLEKYYRKSYCGYADQFLDKIKDYDNIVLADVIEHVVDPFEFLNAIITNLNKEGRVLLSVPNVAFADIRLKLLSGQFNYVESGILEITHLRFFTYHSLRALFAKLNVYVEKEYFLCRHWIRGAQQEKLLSFSNFIKLARDETADVYQYVFILRREPVAKSERAYTAKDAFIKKIAKYFYGFLRRYG